mmetsp:Transcript_52595/g.168578  ORF Transcript_52595/g.168578 Transcript_52595/m.168578 type:complete len:183 (-) Transcript_52595:99-647(-)
MSSLSGRTLTFSFSSHVGSEVMFAWQLKERLEQFGADVHALNHSDASWKQSWVIAAKKSDLIVVIDGEDYWEYAGGGDDVPSTRREAVLIAHAGKAVAIVSPKEKVDTALAKVQGILLHGLPEDDLKEKLMIQRECDGQFVRVMVRDLQEAGMKTSFVHGMIARWTAEWVADGEMQQVWEST